MVAVWPPVLHETVPARTVRPTQEEVVGGDGELEGVQQWAAVRATVSDMRTPPHFVPILI